MGDPRNSGMSGDGFRFYRWTDLATGEDTDVLSVTSIRKLAGEPFMLVNWQIANVIDVAMGTAKRTVIGPRGGVKDVRVSEQFPSEFSERYLSTDGKQEALDDLRKWVRAQADSPRNVAAMRGSIVHSLIEKNVKADRVDEAVVESEFLQLSQRDRTRHGGVDGQDVAFVVNSMRQYEAMRKAVDFTIIAREVQCWNLTAGYAGTFDALLWVPDSSWDGTSAPAPSKFTYQWVVDHGGQLVLGDWKTSKDVYAEHVIQLHAYMAAEFVGNDGVVDRRLTDLLTGTNHGALLHIRPNQWGMHQFDFRQDVLRAFLGSVAFARFLAVNQTPQALFTNEQHGSAE